EGREQEGVADDGEHGEIPLQGFRNGHDWSGRRSTRLFYFHTRRLYASSEFAMPPGRRSVVASAPQKKTGSVGVRHEAAQEQSKNSLGERRIDLPALQADTDGESELGQEGLGPLELLESSPALAAKFVHEDPRLCDPCRETHFRPPTWSGGAFRRISRIAASPPQRRRDGTRKPAPSREMHPTSATQLSTVHGYPSSQTASLEHGGSV